MRNLKTFFYDINHKLNVLFPLIGLFHVAMFIWVLWSNLKGIFVLEDVAWITGLTFFWIFVCDARKWAAWGYILLTSIDLILYALVRSQHMPDHTSSMLIIDVLFSFFVLYFYRKFQ